VCVCVCVCVLCVVFCVLCVCVCVLSRSKTFVVCCNKENLDEMNNYATAQGSECGANWVVSLRNRYSRHLMLAQPHCRRLAFSGTPHSFIPNSNMWSSSDTALHPEELLKAFLFDICLSGFFVPFDLALRSYKF